MKKYLDKIRKDLTDMSRLFIFEDPDMHRSKIHLNDPRKTPETWYKYCVKHNINSKAAEAQERDRIEDLVNDVTALLLYEDKLKDVVTRREIMLTQVVNKACDRDAWLIQVRL